MASNTRQQLEGWLKTLEVEGSVIDLGGLFWPVKGRTKTWNVPRYAIFDIKKSRNGVTAEFTGDLNDPVEVPEKFNNAFILETLNHIYDPIQCFKNINKMLLPYGEVVGSVHFLFPHHSGLDCLRYTQDGVRKILEKTGFEMKTIVPKWAMWPEALNEFCTLESKVYRHPGEIGYVFSATKIRGL